MRVAILSDSPFICTGFSNQSKMLAKHLTDKGHEVHFLANAYTGQPVVYSRLEDGTEFKYKIYGQKSQYFQQEMSHLMKEIKPDIFLILLDTFMLHGQPRNMNAGWFGNIDTSPARTIFWYPSDGGGGLPLACDNILRKVNQPVAMSKFGQKQVKDYYNIDAECIPHGTEPDRFFKLSDEERDKLRIKWGLKGKFVIGSVFRNQPRKNPDKYFKTFNKVMKKIPNAVLLLHSDPNDIAGQILLQNQIIKYNMENRVIFTGMSAMRAFHWNEMNEVYNLMDVFFLPTSGEGFGIPTIEAMSCEVPCLVTDYTSTQELVKDNKTGFGIKLVGCNEYDQWKFNMKDYDKLVDNGTMTGGLWEVERGFCDIEDATKKLEILYNNPQLCEQMGKNGRKAVLEKYDFFKHIGPKFEELMLSMIK